jgi:hypothetical protein
LSSCYNYIQIKPSDVRLPIRDHAASIALVPVVKIFVAGTSMTSLAFFVSMRPAGS